MVLSLLLFYEQVSLDMHAPDRKTLDRIHNAGGAATFRHLRPPRRGGRSLVFLILIQVSSLAVPLATMPFLTRVLGPAAWGHLAALQALSVTLAIVVEYGFQYTATRAISLERDQPGAVKRIASEVAAAKIVLSVGAAAFGFLIYALVPAFHESWVMLAWAVVYAIFQGWSPIWFFQGMEQLEWAAAIDVVSKLLSALCIFVAVRTPEDGIIVLAAQTVMTALATFINLFRVQRVAGRAPLVLQSIGPTLANGFPLFLFRAMVTVYSAGSTALLRGMTNSIEAGNYANADRLTSAAKSLIVPIGQVMYPKISRLHSSDPRYAKGVMMMSLAAVTIPFALVAALSITLSPWLLPLFFGPNYEPTVPMFQVLSLTLPLVAASNVLGIQWMLARGRQKTFSGIIAASAVVGLICMAVTVPAAGGLGMAWSVVTAEGVAVIAMALHAWLGREPAVASHGVDSQQAVPVNASGSQPGPILRSTSSKSSVASSLEPVDQPEISKDHPGGTWSA